MGATQHTVGTANVRAFCIACLATGNVGSPGTGANIFRGHTNVQGATDLGLDITTLPLYYGLTEGAWKHWARVWEVDLRLAAGLRRGAGQGRPQGPHAQGEHGDARHHLDALVRRGQPARGPDRPARRSVKAMVVLGHGGNTVTRIPEAVKGMEKLELLVVADPHPTTFAALDATARTTSTCCRSARSSRCDGSRTASNRSLQWGEKVVEPIFESKDDYEVMYLLAKKLGFADADVQEHQGREQRARRRGPPARDQPRRLVDRLLRPVAGAPQGAHAQPGQVRPGDAARAEGRPGGRRRLLRPALAVLGQAGDPPSRHAHPLQHQPAREGRRRHLPRPLRRRAQRRRRCWPKTPTRWARRSPTAIPSSPWAC